MALSLRGWLLFAAQLRARRGLGSLALAGGMLAGAPAACRVGAALVRTLPGALALLPGAGLRELALEAAGLIPSRVWVRKFDRVS